MSPINKDEWKRVDKFPDIQKNTSESIPDVITRNITRAGLGAVSSILGLPKDVYSLLKSGAEMIPESIKQPIKQGIQSNPYTSVPYNLITSAAELAPGSEDIKKGITVGSEAIGAPSGFFEPQGEKEQLLDTIVSDVASLMVPIGPIGGVKPLKALGISGASNLASFLTKKIGGSEGAQEGVKLGTALLTSLNAGPSLRKKADSLYDIVEGIASTRKRVPTKPLTKLMNNISQDFLESGLKTEQKEKVKSVIDQLNGYTKRNSMSVRELWRSKKDLKDIIKEVGIDTEPGKHLLDLNKKMNEVLKNSPNKQLSNALSMADEFYGGSKQAEKINHWLKNHVLNNKFFTGGYLYSLLQEPVKTLEKTGLAIGATSLGLAGAKTTDVINNIIKYPHIRNEYGRMLSAAAKENAPLTLKYAKKLENSLKKQNPIVINKSEWKRV